MSGHTIRLTGDAQRARAIDLISKAPANAIVQIKPEKRSNDQNALMWVLISQVSMAKPRGLHKTTDVWKCLFMEACNHAVTFETGLDGRPFPIGHQSSKLSVPEMRDLIEFIYSWGTENGVTFDDNPNEIAMLEGMRA